MSLSAKLRRAPLRIATGAYILNTGVTKLGADDDTAKSLHGMATGTYPFLGRIDPKLLAKGVAVGELAVGTVVLLPVVPPAVAGAALVGFSGALLNMYWNTPGMHHEGSLRPTPQGTPVSKDVWLLGIGLGLLTDATLESAHDRVAELEASVSQTRAERSRRARRKARKAARRARIGGAAYLAQARTRAEKTAEATAARLADVRAEYAPIAIDKAHAARDAARHAAEEYGPVAVDKAYAARDAARHVAEEYGPVAVDKARTARAATRHAAQQAAERAQHALH